MADNSAIKLRLSPEALLLLTSGVDISAARYRAWFEQGRVFEIRSEDGGLSWGQMREIACPLGLDTGPMQVPPTKIRFARNRDRPCRRRFDQGGLAALLAQVTATAMLRGLRWSVRGARFRINLREIVFSGTGDRHVPSIGNLQNIHAH